MSQYLVLTAMGACRTESVSELTKLVSECGCNIIDSRMAVFKVQPNMLSSFDLIANINYFNDFK